MKEKQIVCCPFCKVYHIIELEVSGHRKATELVECHFDNMTQDDVSAGKGGCGNYFLVVASLEFHCDVFKVIK